ncbi:MAG: radical SAM-associated putative lipoprotein [Draconibacterium sp.]
MKNRILKSQNKIIAFLLSVLGIGSAGIFGGCNPTDAPVEYGSPSATFVVKGKVTNEAEAGIKGIKVKMVNDSTATDQNGQYEIDIVDFPTDREFQIQFEDIDSAANGNYEKMDTVVTFVDPVFKNPDGNWYAGETTKEFDIKLREKE